MMKRKQLLLLVGTIILAVMFNSCTETLTPIDPGGGGGGGNIPAGFSGRIVDTTTNTPIVGATVWLFAKPQSEAKLSTIRSRSKRINSFIMYAEPFDHRYSGTALQKVTTDSSGRFLLDTLQFTQVNYTIAVTHPNYTWKYYSVKGSKLLGDMFTKPVITVQAGAGQTFNWNIADQDYVVSGTINPTSLTIAAGVRVRVNPASGITFLNGGTFTATSSSELTPIRITVNSDNTTDFMGNIAVLTSAVTLNNVHISGGGAQNSPTITFDEATGSITRTIITNCNNGVTFRGLKVPLSLNFSGNVIRYITNTAITAVNSTNNTVENSVIYNTNLGVNHSSNSSLDYINCYIEGATNAYSATGGSSSLISCDVIALNGAALLLMNQAQASIDSCELVGKVSLNSNASGVQVGFISDCNLMGTDAQFVVLTSLSYYFLGCYFNSSTSETQAKSKIQIPSGNDINNLQILGTLFARIPGAGLKTW